MGKQLKSIRPERDLASPKRGARSELAKYAVADGAREPAAGGNFISIKGKAFRAGGDVLGDPLNVVIVDYAFENAYYGGRDYDEDNPEPPVCFAIGKTEDELAPDEKSPDPQAETCAECPQNAFGSAEKGRGKACKNARKLALISADVKKFDAQHVQGAEVRFMRLPPKSLGHFKGYIKKLTEGLQLPTFAAVTSLTFDEDEAFPVVVPSFESEVGDDKKLLNALIAKREGVQKDLLTTFDPASFADRKKEKPKKLKPKKRKF